MPTYEYRCQDGHEFEVVQSIKDEPLKKCTAVIYHVSHSPDKICEAPVERLISKSSFVLKGSGWTGKTYA